jgi:DNA-binding transcriptional MocR family regulator
MNYNFSDRLKNLEANAIREIFKLISKPGIISFAGGLPATEALPKGEIKQIFNEILAEENSVALLQYGASEGYAPLLAEGAKYLERVNIRVKDASELVVISGGQQGIDLACKAFINKGDIVLVEEPTYLAILHILKTYEAVAVGVKSGDDGIDVEDLEAKIKKHNPKMVYLVPTFSNPTGITISVEKRKQIAALVAKYNTVLIEDNPYGELRFSGEAVPAIKSFDETGNVIYLASFSKIISPGMRVGLAAGNSQIIRKMVLGKQATDVHTSLINQAIIARYLQKGFLNPIIEKNIPLYKQKLDAMLSAMQKHFPEGVTFTKPDGGLFIWVTLPKNVDAGEMFLQAVEQKVAYVAGENFFATEGAGKNTLRLNFSNATLENIEIGIKTLGEIIKSRL